MIPDAPEKYFLSLAQTEKLLYRSSEERRATGSTIPTESPVHRQREAEGKG